MAYLFLIWSFCFANPLKSLRVTRVTLSFKLHDYAFSAMVTVESMCISEASLHSAAQLRLGACAEGHIDRASPKIRVDLNFS